MFSKGYSFDNGWTVLLQSCSEELWHQTSGRGWPCWREKETKIKKDAKWLMEKLREFPPPEANLITRTTNVRAVRNRSRRSGDDQTNNTIMQRFNVHQKLTLVVLWYTWVRHVFELRTSSDHQENQIEDVECHYNQEEYLHGLENTELD